MDIKNLTFRMILVLLGFSLTSFFAFAGPVVSGGGVGDRTRYLTCESDQFHFIIQGTPAPSFKQGVLTAPDGKTIARLACLPGQSHLFPEMRATETFENILWSCRQYPFHDGNILIQVEISDSTGLKSASISQMQAFPSEPQTLGTLNCKSETK